MAAAPFMKVTKPLLWLILTGESLAISYVAYRYKLLMIYYLSLLFYKNIYILFIFSIYFYLLFIVL